MEVGGGDGTDPLSPSAFSQLPWGCIRLPEQVFFVPRAHRVGTSAGLFSQGTFLEASGLDTG